MAVRQINLRVNEPLLAAIDERRGLVSRNLWIVATLSGVLGQDMRALEKEAVVVQAPPQVERSPDPQPDPDVMTIERWKLLPRADRQFTVGHNGSCKCLRCEGESLP